MLVIFLETWQGSSVSWGWLEEPATDGVIDNEYFPSCWGESDNNDPKLIYSFAQIFALELTLEVRGTETLVNWTCGLWSYGPVSKIGSTAPIPDWGLVMTLTSSSTACSTSPVGACVTTGVGELLSSSEANFSGEKAVFTACVITAEMVAVIASTSTDTVPGDELEGFEAITLACSVSVLSWTVGASSGRSLGRLGLLLGRTDGMAAGAVAWVVGRFLRRHFLEKKTTETGWDN